jgi:hypothetical protein
MATDTFDVGATLCFSFLEDWEDEFAIQFNKIVELNKGDERKNKDSLKLQHLTLRLFSTQANCQEDISKVKLQ